MAKLLTRGNQRSIIMGLSKALTSLTAIDAKIPTRNPALRPMVAFAPAADAALTAAVTALQGRCAALLAKA